MEGKHPLRWDDPWQDDELRQSRTMLHCSWVILLFLVIVFSAGGFVLRFPPADARNSASGTDNPANEQRLLALERTQAKLNNRIVTLEKQTGDLEAKNARLTHQLAVVTGPKGVLARLIGQLRTVKGQSAYLERALLGGGTETGTESMANATTTPLPTPRPKHTIVTRMNTASAKSSDEKASSRDKDSEGGQ